MNTTTKFATHTDDIPLYYEYQEPGDLSPISWCADCANHQYNKGLVDPNYIKSDYFDPGVDIEHEAWCNECGYPLGA